MHMSANSVLLAIASVSFYLLATLLIFLRAQRASAGQFSSDAGNGQLIPTVVALLLHLLLLYDVILGGHSVNFGLGASFTLFAWLTTFMSLAIALHTRLPALLMILLPLNILSIILALLLPVHWSPHGSYSAMLIAHIAFSLLAYGLLSIAALIAILLAFQDFQLHNHQQGMLLKQLPPLQTLETLLFHLIEAGFLLLSFSVVSGFLFTHDWFNHKILFSIIAWVVFLILLLGRHIAGWRGKTAIRWTLAGIVALMLAIFGTKLVIEYILV